MVSTPDPLIAILTGPTGVGKSEIALEFARKHGNLELINADSILVYKHLDIGSAKPKPDELKSVPHHLIDLCDPSETFTLGDFYKQALTLISEIHQRGNRAVIVGGTAFYLQSLLYGLWEGAKGSPEIREKLEQETSTTLYERLKALDKKSALRIGQNDRYRLLRSLEAYETSGKTPSELEESLSKTPDPRFRVWVLERKPDELMTRIKLRTQKMLEAGLIEEVRWLLENHPTSRVLNAVGYRETVRYLKDEKPKGRVIPEGLAGLEEEIVLGTRQLIKRQRTWFRSQKDWTRFTLDQELPRLMAAFESIYL